MKRRCSHPVPFWLTVCALAAVLHVPPAHAADALKIHTQLIWATNDRQSSDPRHVPVDEALARKFRRTYRWTNYFEINEMTVSIPYKGMSAIQISDPCRLEVGNLGGDWVEIKHFGQGKLVSTHKEKVAVDRSLILAGNGSNDTAWFVVIKKIDPNKKKAGITPIAPVAPIVPPAPLAPAAPTLDSPK